MVKWQVLRGRFFTEANQSLHFFDYCVFDSFKEAYIDSLKQVLKIYQVETIVDLLDEEIYSKFKRHNKAIERLRDNALETIKQVEASETVKEETSTEPFYKILAVTPVSQYHMKITRADLVSQEAPQIEDNKC